MKLKPYQHAAIDFMAERSWSVLALDMRMGKSACALLDARSHARLLIICPVIAVYPWYREIQKWTPKRLDHGVQVLSQHASEVDPEAHVHIMPYSLLDSFRQAKLPQPGYLVVDEMHYIKNPEAQRTRVVTSLMKHVERGSCLSGTPMPSRPHELLPVLMSLGTVKNQVEYEKRFCAGHMSEWGWSARGATNLDELSDLLGTVMFRRTKADLKGQWAEVQPPTIVELDLPLDEREKEFAKWDIEKLDFPLVFEAISTLLHENALRKVPMAVEHIKNVLETEKKIVVFAWHRDVIEALQEGLADYHQAFIHGGVSAKNRDQEVQYFQNDPSCRLMIANYQAAAESITLDKASYVVFVECSWVPKDIDQPVARLSGHGQHDTVRTDILTIHKSIDANVLHTVLTKKDHIETVVKETKMPDKKDASSRKRVPIAKLDQTIRTLVETRAHDKKITVMSYLMALFPANHPPKDVDDKHEEAPPEKKAKKTKKTKKVEVPVAQPKEEGILIDDDPAPEMEQEEITSDKLRRQMAQTLDICGPQKVKDALADLGAAKLSDLKEDQFLAMYEACEDLLNAEEY